MKIELLVSEWCPTCPAAERDIELALVDLAQFEGRELARRLGIRTIPAVVLDGVLAAVGVQSLAEARQTVAGAPLRAKS